MARDILAFQASPVASERKHSTAAKTIPVDISEKFNQSREIHVLKPEKKASVKTPATTVDVTQLLVKCQKNIPEKVNNKVCAIICTSAWFYFLPRFRPKNKAVVAGKNGGVAGDVDINSDEYKKKVVLEGFLERNHRSGVVS
nr:uncharacterized protein At5g23160-like [Nicotiana tomentosiformis]